MEVARVAYTIVQRTLTRDFASIKVIFVIFLCRHMTRKRQKLDFQVAGVIICSREAHQHT